jgi:hypothetical protein
VHPGIFEIPRRANNLFYNVASPADWAAEYNCRYRSFWARDLTYPEILDVESQRLLAYLLRGEMDPWMFHQANLAAYDGRRSLLSDLLDTTLSQYRRVFTLPIVSPSMDEVGRRMANRTLASTGGVTGTIQPGAGLLLSSPVDVTVPVTGLASAGAESYGGQSISWISLEANRPLFVPMARTPGVQPPTATAAATPDATPLALVTLTGTGTDHNVPPRSLTFAWTQIAGPSVALINANAPVATFTAPPVPADSSPVTLGFRLTVGNGLLSATSTTSVVVRAAKPLKVAIRRSATTLREGDRATLTATVVDPNVPARPLSYAWAQISGPAVVLTNAATPVARFVAPRLPRRVSSATLGFRLTVTNGLTSASATTTVTVRK